MTTKEDVRDIFIRKLKQLLDEFDVSFILEADTLMGYGSCPDYSIVAEFEDWNLKDIDFGSRLDKDWKQK